MQVKCFACPAMLDAADADSAERVFLAHGRDVHAWTYPEQALRNYARNYAEATERLSPTAERLEAIGEVTVHEATPDRIDDWLRFFDHDGFAGNADCASCYCLEPHVPATPDLPERLWSHNRAAVAARLNAQTTRGYLAYVDGRAVGWVNASCRSDYGLFAAVDPEGPKAQFVVGVSCFVIAPPYRRHGVASKLLDAVIAGASASGASWIEAYPHTAPEAGDAGHFRGARSMFEARGFVAVEARGSYTVMRRRA